jgi:hypothetical protein
LRNEVDFQISLPCFPKRDLCCEQLGRDLFSCVGWLILFRGFRVLPLTDLGFVVARAVRVDISEVSPIETLIDEVRCPSRLMSPWAVKVRFRFPTTTKKPFSSVSRAKYQPSFGVGN